VRVPGVRRLRLAVRRLRSRIFGGSLVLGYHRVVEASSDPYALCVAPRRFAEQLEVLRAVARPVSLRELLNGVHERRVPPGAVAVTFDDGYADNLSNALPLLEQYEVPATVFVTSGYLGRQFWWDELECLVPGAEGLRGVLRLTIRGRPYEWNFERLADHGKETSGPRLRRQVLMALHRLLAPLSEGERGLALKDLADWAGSATNGRPTDRALSPEELTKLAESELVEIGSHSATHPFLATLPPALQRSEIQESKVRLESLLGREITTFAYPHGSLSSATVTLVQEAGFAAACTSMPDAVRPSSDPYQLPRLWAKDLNGDAFARWLKGWLPR